MIEVQEISGCEISLQTFASPTLVISARSTKSVSEQIKELKWKAWSQWAPIVRQMELSGFVHVGYRDEIDYERRCHKSWVVWKQPEITFKSGSAT